MIALIAGISKNNCIGINGDLPWHIPEDMAHFKKITTGHTVIMGRKTWESIPQKYRPLPNRKNIVLTRNTHYDVPSDVMVCSSLSEALDKTKDTHIFLIGGSSVYTEGITKADRLHITHVHKHIDGDTFFPEIDPLIWKETTREDHTDFSFVTYTKK